MAGRSVGAVPTAEQAKANSSVLMKLTIFMILIAIVPIGIYFSTLRYVWNGSSTWAALSAVLSANIVLVSYVVLAFKEDAAERREADKAIKGKKAQ